MAQPGLLSLNSGLGPDRRTQRPLWKPLRRSAGHRPSPTAASRLDQRLGRSAQGYGPALPGAAAGLHPHRRRRVAPAAARCPGRAAARTPLAAGPPPGPRSGIVRGPHHPGARSREGVAQTGRAACALLPRLPREWNCLGCTMRAGPGGGRWRACVTRPRPLGVRLRAGAQGLT